MDLLKKYWRIIAFCLVCLGSLGMGGYFYMAGAEITEKMQAIDRLKNSVVGAQRGAANMSVIEARAKEIADTNAEFEESMNAALAMQRYNPFYEKVDESGKCTPVLRAPLIPNVLPQPASNADAISFRAKYIEAFAELPRRLRARDKATPDEVKDFFERWDALKRGVQGTDWRPWGPGGGSVEPEASDKKKERSRAEILREYPRSRLAEEIARKIYMYLDPGAIGRHYIADKQDVPTEIDIWQAQMSLWIQQDMVTAIARVNEKRAAELEKAGQADRAWVAYMPVKRLTKLCIENRLGRGGGSNAGNFGVSFTQTNNDEKKFMVPVALEMVVEEAAIPQIIDEVCRVGFYTPTNVHYELAKPNPIQDDYVYGESPILEVRIEFEGYYFRKVFDEWIPKVLKDVLKNPDAKDPKA